MAMAKKQYAFYPGCSSQLKASAANYLTSVQSMSQAAVWPLASVIDVCRFKASKT